MLEREGQEIISLPALDILNGYNIWQNAKNHQQQLNKKLENAGSNLLAQKGFVQ